MPADIVPEQKPPMRSAWTKQLVQLAGVALDVIKAIAIFIFAAAALVCAFTFMVISSQKRESRIELATNKATEEEERACQTASYVAPTWRTYGNPSIPSSHHFFCADKNGELHPVIEPKCNTRDLDNCL